MLMSFKKLMIRHSNRQLKITAALFAHRVLSDKSAIMSGRGAYYKAKYGGGRGNKFRTDHDRSNGFQQTGNQYIEQVYDNVLDNQITKKQSTHLINEDLIGCFQRIDGLQYGSYKSIEGVSFKLPLINEMNGILKITHVQSDAYAPPSKLIVQIPIKDLNIPKEFISSKIRRIALADYMNREFCRICSLNGLDYKRSSGGWAGVKGGDISMEKPSQHVLERSSIQILIKRQNENNSKNVSINGGHCFELSDDDIIEVRFTLGLPARGRTIEGRLALSILTDGVPRIILQSLFWDNLDIPSVIAHIYSIEDQQELRKEIIHVGLVAFVINGAILPRLNGASDSCLSTAYPFQSPNDMEYEFILPNKGRIIGMGIKKGISLIVGGGFHGKSTLLRALEVGIYNHIPGDGREFVVCHPTAVKIRAEDGRAVTALDISMFINNIPYSVSTKQFTTGNASGSTSQAANIIENIQLESRLLLLDEDTCATNFMLRDEIMSALVTVDKEPITPFLERASSLYIDYDVSTILVVGGSGVYFSVAHTVLMMDNYQCKNVTNQAKEIYQQFNNSSSSKKHTNNIESNNATSLHISTIERSITSGDSCTPPTELLSSNCSSVVEFKRFIDFTSLKCHGKIRVHSLDKIEYGGEGDEKYSIQLNGIEQLVEIGQVRAIAEIFQYLATTYHNEITRNSSGSNTNLTTHNQNEYRDHNQSGLQHDSPYHSNMNLKEMCGLEKRLENEGPDCLKHKNSFNDPMGNLVVPRVLDVAAAINRWRQLRVLT